MERLNTAQKMVAAWLGVDPEWFTPQTARVAVSQTQAMAGSYKAPHAGRGTPKKLLRGKVTEMVFSKAHNALIAKRRPFKGYRA